MMALLRLNAPWTVEQVAALNRFQQAGFVHPFTCPSGFDLVATESGWTCPHCSYTQSWAFEAMLEEPRAVFSRPASPPDAFDPECLHLAEHFIGVTATNARQQCRALAHHIQQAVEDWLAVNMTPTEGASP